MYKMNETGRPAIVSNFLYREIDRVGVTKYSVILLILCALWLVASALPVFGQDEPLPDIIEFENSGMLPEGIEYDPIHEQFLVGSMTLGGVYSVSMDGELNQIITDEELVSTIGLEVDLASNRLLVTNTNFFSFFAGQGEPVASLGAYDLETGERLYMSDLLALRPDDPHFINDVAVDGEGNAYVTDTALPLIYRVDPEGNAEVWLEDEDTFLTEVDFGDGPFVFTFNGIAYHPDGYLIAAHLGGQQLVRIPLDDPEAYTIVEIDIPIFGDGIIFDKNNDLIVVDGMGMTLKLHSEDEWVSADLVATATIPNATTSVLVNGTPYVVIAYLNAQPPADEFQIVAVEFTETE